MTSLPLEQLSKTSLLRGWLGRGSRSRGTLRFDFFLPNPSLSMTSSDHLICLDSVGTARNLRVPVVIVEWWDNEGAVSSNVWPPVPSVVAIAVLAIAQKVVLRPELSKRNFMNSPQLVQLSCLLKC